MKLSIRTAYEQDTLREVSMNVEDRASYSGEQLLAKYSEKCSALMCGITEEIIRSIVPDGVHAGTWARKHFLSIGIRKISSGLKHVVLKDDEVVAEVVYRDGKITSRVFMGRGHLSESK